MFFYFWSESLISSSLCNHGLIRKWMKEADKEYIEMEKKTEESFLVSINKKIEKKEQRSLPEMSRSVFYSIFQIDEFNTSTRKR